MASPTGDMKTDNPDANPIMDSTDTIPDSTEELLTNITSNLQTTLFDIWQSFLAHTPFLIAGLFILVVTWGVVRVFRRVGHRAFRRSDMRESLQQLSIRLVTIGIWLFGFLVAATLWFPGMTPTSLLGGLGLLSVAIGFAFQDIFENFFAGILILWRFPFEKGDFIECEGIEGRVEDVTVRMTEIRQTSGELVLVPNSMLFKNPVEILTNLKHRRVTVMCGVAYDVDVAAAVEVITKAVAGCDTVVTDDHPIQIFPQGFGSSSIDIEVTWWTESKPVDVRQSRAQVVIAVKSALDEAGIEIPFPYRTLTFKEPLQTQSRSGDHNANL